MDAEQRAPEEVTKAPAGLRVVVSLDLSDSSYETLEVAKNVVRPFGEKGELHAVHVMSPMYPTVELAGVFVASDPEIIGRIRKRLLDMCLSGSPVAGSVVPHVRIGDATHEVATLAREIQADLIVIGGHRREGIAGALSRSMSAKLVRKAPCSVLTAIPKEVEGAPEREIEPACPDCLIARRDSSGSVFWCARHSVHHVHGHLHGGSSDNGVDSWTFRT
jgi:nucleotide-binding universal stress UspA family protein